MRTHLASFVEDFRRWGRETAVVGHRGNRRYRTTYAELAELAGRFAAELDRRGIQPGERVVLWGENSAEWIAVFFGCLLRGVIAVPLDAAGTVEFASSVIQDVGARLVVGDGKLLGAIYPGFESARPTHRDQAAINAAPSGGRVDPAGWMELAGIGAQLPAEPLYAVSEAVGEQTPFQIVFTSGTTAEPRGIVHTHRNVLVTLGPIEREMARYRRYERWVHPLRFLHSVPLSHMFGQFMGLWIPGVLAAELHFAEQLEPSRMVELVRRERVSVLVAVPRVLQMVRAHLLGRFAGLGMEIEGAVGWKVWQRWWRFRRVHRALGWKFWAVISGGAMLPAELEEFWNRLGFALIQGYGMTETSALVTLNHPFRVVQGSIGRPLPGREVRLTEEGEILVRGPMVAGATWSGGAMHAREGEWLATGDLAAKDAAGDLRFLGRKGDVIVTGAGMNVHPADLEKAMLRQPGVRGCAVVACEFASGPEAVAVALFAGSVEELDAAVTAANAGLAEYQKIRRVLRWPEMQLPYTATGKLLRREVKAWACGQLAGSGVSARPVRQDALLGMIAAVTGEAAAVGADADRLRLSEDLHLDSLGRVELQSALEEKLGVELDEDALGQVRTVGELRRLVQGEGLVTGEKEEADPSASLRDDNKNEAAAKGTGGSASATLGAAEVGEHVYPRWPWSWPVQALRTVWVEMIMRPLVWLLAGPRVVRRAELPEGPVLVVVNHLTAFDGALALYALPGRVRRRMAIAMQGQMLLDLRHGRQQGSWLLDLLAPAGYWLITALFNVYPLPQARGFRRSFAHAGEAMDRGYSVMVFPEGARSRDGRMHAFRAGIGLLAEESRVPVVPVAIAGLGEIVAEQAAGGSPRWWRSGRIEVRVGEAIAVHGAAVELAATLEQAVRALLAEVR